MRFELTLGPPAVLFASFTPETCSPLKTHL